MAYGEISAKYTCLMSQGRKVKNKKHTCQQAAIGRELEPTSIAQLVHYGTTHFLILTIPIIAIGSIVL